MIARPVHRPTPIAFDGPKAKPGASQPRAISWAAASGPAPHEPPAMQPRPFVATRLSPVKPPLTPAPLAPARQAAVSAMPVAPKPVKSPYDNPTASELSARYVGQGALSVRSSVTGRHYRFQGHGDSQKVDKHDLMLLKRIADLVIR
jgi:hypothetical protein